MSGVIECEMSGGFANRMSKYAFARAYAERHGCELRTNAWNGQKIFEIDDPPMQGGLPDRDTFNFETWDGETNVSIRGESQHQKHLIYTRADALRFFRYRPEIVDVLEPVPAYPVAAHLRWGDFVNQNGFIAITKRSYLEAAAKFGISGEVRFVSEEEPLSVPGIEGGFRWKDRKTDDLPGLGFLPDFEALRRSDVLFRAPSTFSFWAAVLGTHSRVFSPDLQGINWRDCARGWQDAPFVQGNRSPITSWWTGHSELRLAGTPIVSRSQAAQDEWANQILPHGGTFLDVGCGYAEHINNSKALEEIGWTGFLVDFNPACAADCRERRTSPVIEADATTHDFSTLPVKNFDYLSLDVDEGEVATLENLLRAGVTFKAATIEHASYLYGPGPRDAIRKILLDRGYVIHAADVSCGGNPFEDWWVSPDLSLTT